MTTSYYGLDDRLTFVLSVKNATLDRVLHLTRRYGKNDILFMQDIVVLAIDFHALRVKQIADGWKFHVVFYDNDDLVILKGGLLN